MSKGFDFERKICKELSLWWSNGENDNVFWRTAGSGARATTRTKKGKKTSGMYGDIMAVDPIGKPFTDLVTVEIKRGFSRHTIFDLLDAPKTAKTQLWRGWIEKLETTANEAGTLHWMLVTKRDHRETIVTMPKNLWYTSNSLTTNEKTIEWRGFDLVLISTPLDHFFKIFSPDDFKNN